MKLTEDVTKICDKHIFNGVVLLTDFKKKLAYEAYGYHDIESKELLKKDELFRIGSITKQFTAVAILQLIENKQLNMMDPIAMYIDEVDYDEEVTVHHLLSNSSGIPNFDPMGNFDDILLSNNVNERLVKEVILTKPLLFTPGARFDYSSSGFIILAYLIELISKKPYDVYLKDHIFKPLKMKHSGFHFKDTSKDGFAGLYELKEGKPVPAMDIDMRIASGGGGLFSTAKDLYLWNIGLLRYKILSKKYVDKMFAVQTPISDTGGYGYGVISDTFDKENQSYKVIYHPGNGPGVFAQNTIYDNHIQLIMISNINDGKTFRATFNDLDELVKDFVVK